MARSGVSAPHATARVGVIADGWRQAIRLAVEPLVQVGAVEQRYVEACVAVIEEHGPYIVVAPGIALVHARPEDGVRTLGLSVVMLAHPVEFGHPSNDPVHAVFAFGSPDRDQHVGLLAALSRRLCDGLAEELRAAASDTEATGLLQEVIDDVVA